MQREVVKTTAAPAAIGPYSQAVRAGNFVYTAGQLGIDPATGDLVAGLEAQVEQILMNLSNILEAAGSNMDNVVKTTCFLADLADFKVFNAIYGSVFSANRPARSTIQAAALPAGALVEIEAIALID